jgi:hypothetical protein
MKISVLKELNQYVNDLIKDKVLTKENFDDWHYIAFNHLDPFETVYGEEVISSIQDNFYKY